MRELTTKQLEKLATKNREASQKKFREEQEKRGVDKPKETGYIYVNRSVDPKFEDVDHRSLFREMKKKPYEE